MYISKTTSLEKQKKETLRMLQKDFKIILSDEEKARINKADTVRQVQRIGVDIINNANWEGV